MNEIQILGLVATVLGIITAVFNLVAFVREKDRGHLRAGIMAIVVLAVVIGVLAFPHLAPGTARSLADGLPQGLKPWLGAWLSPASTAPAAAASSKPSPSAAPILQGSAQVDIRRNLLGGIDTVVAVFRFADLSNRGGRVLSWELVLQPQPGAATQRFAAVLDAPVVVSPGGTSRTEVRLDGPAREAWLARHKEKARGAGEVRWQGLDADGRTVELSAPLPD